MALSLLMMQMWWKTATRTICYFPVFYLQAPVRILHLISFGVVRGVSKGTPIHLWGLATHGCRLVAAPDRITVSNSRVLAFANPQATDVVFKTGVFPDTMDSAILTSQEKGATPSQLILRLVHHQCQLTMTMCSYRRCVGLLYEQNTKDLWSSHTQRSPQMRNRRDRGSNSDQ